MSTTQNYFYSLSGVQSGNKVKLLASGIDIFSELLTLISQAQHRIVLQTYTYEADDIGKNIAKALTDAASRGVSVKLMVDSIGSFFTGDKFFQDLRTQGVDVRYYHAIRLFKLDWKIFKRNHRKILVVDAEKTLIGGFNIANHYWKPHQAGGTFDLAVRIDGPSASEAWELFDKSWHGFHRSKFFAKINLRQKSRPRMGPQQVAVLGNDHFLERWKIRRELLYSFSQAVTSIDIMNPYFLPDPGVLKGLLDARARGIKVRVLLPRFTDVALIDLASTVIQKKLIVHGVEIYKWEGFLHAKMVLVDNIMSSIGSFNLDYRSLFHNLEVNVHVFDKHFAQNVLNTFEEALLNAKRVDLKELARMSTSSKMVARLVYRLRAFL